MLSLVIYVASFLAVTSLVGIITTFFYNNLKIINTDMGSSAYYNKLNLFMANEAKKSGNKILKYAQASDGNNSYITFEDNLENKNTFVKLGDIIYYNKIALCKNVSDFNVKVDNSGVKKNITVFVTIDGIAYSTKYVVEE